MYYVVCYHSTNVLRIRYDSCSHFSRLIKLAFGAAYIEQGFKAQPLRPVLLLGVPSQSTETRTRALSLTPLPPSRLPFCLPLPLLLSPAFARLCLAGCSMQAFSHATSYSPPLTAHD